MATRRKSPKKPRGGPDSPPARRRKKAASAQTELFRDESAPLGELAQSRYLNYALSVITSRALPDVRDGLKPVQRRILYTMWQQRLTSDAKHRKCAKIVGDVMGSYHPHGDAAIYDALVRTAQPFAMRMPLVDGSGNFGSVDGDPAAAMRYTECRLSALSTELLTELNQDTVFFRPNYDGTKTEPVVLPAKIPNLLINGATGIAVGMATSIPPHNPEEVTNAAIRLLDALLQNRQLSVRELCRTIKGPDLPTGGHIISSQDQLKQLYESGQGSLKLRATWEKGPTQRGSKLILVTSIPYTVNKSQLVERIAELVTSRKMPLLLDVRDVSAKDIRIELELKRDADEQKVLSFLFKHTPLQINLNVNFTCLIPTENPEVGRPERLDLRSILWHFLQFRRSVVTRRLEHELRAIERRMHILAGFERVFDALDQILGIIRKSDGKADAAATIIRRFKLDAEQTDAILELRLYRLARLEILVIKDELKQKRKRATELRRLLGEQEAIGIWNIIRAELIAFAKGSASQQKRRTRIETVDQELEFSEEDLIVAEDNHVLLTRDGWVKRQREIKDPAASRMREGDAVLSCVAGSTRSMIVFFSSFGTAYSCRVIDVPATTGYGEPIQKLFKLKDGERIVAAHCLDARAVGEINETKNEYPETYALSATSDGYAMCFGLSSFAEPSTRSGRRFAKPAKGSRVLSVLLVHGEETVIAASMERRALLCKVEEVNYLSGPGRGVMLIKLGPSDHLLGVKAVTRDSDALIVKTSLGGEQRVSLSRYGLTSRAGRGREIIKRGRLVSIVPDAPTAPPALSREEQA